MIEVMLEHEKKHVTIRFPCTEAELATKLNDFDFGFDIHNMWVHAFIEPKEFAPMEQQAHDVDELNYLAKRMDSFIDAERRRFFAAITHQLPLFRLKSVVRKSLDPDQILHRSPLSLLSFLFHASYLHSKYCCVVMK